MKIIIVGDGKVGFTLSEQLSHEGHDVTIIDNRNDVLQKSIESLDIIAIKGNGASYDVQMKAGIDEADLLIAATSTDEVNMVCCQLGKKLGVKHTIARIRNPEYNEQLRIMKDDLGLSMIVNPEMEAAEEIARLISFPSALSIGSFAEGKVYIVEFRIDKENPLIGKSISVVHGNYADDVLVCAVNRDSEAFVPHGQFILKQGDRVHIAGSYNSINAYLQSIGQHERKTKSVMIIGGGLVTYYLSEKLVGHDIRVTIIEKDLTRCEHLCENILGALIINGDGTDRALLDSEDMENYDAFVALADLDEENLIMSMYAAYKGVPKIITKVNRLEFSEVIRRAGIDRIISPKNSAANRIIRYVRNMRSAKSGQIKTLYKIIDDRAEILEFTATKDTMNLGIPVAKLPLKKNVLLTTIVRNGRIIIPRGKNMMLEGDTVIIVTTIAQMEDLNDIFE